MCKCTESGGTCSCTSLTCCAQCCRTITVQGQTQTSCSNANCGGQTCSGGPCSPMNRTGTTSARLFETLPSGAATLAGRHGVLLAPAVLFDFAAQVSATVDDSNIPRELLRDTALDVTPLSFSGLITRSTVEVSNLRLRNNSSRRISALVLDWTVDAEGGETTSLTSTWDSFGYPSQFLGPLTEFQLESPIAVIQSHKKNIRSVTVRPVWVEYEGRDAVGKPGEIVLRSIQERRAGYLAAVAAISRGLSITSSNADLRPLFTTLANQGNEPLKTWVKRIQRMYEQEGYDSVIKLVRNTILQ
jgi:hypothetical protein